ncbi:hypothetical protein CHS0354_002935 [Potamilus streckersoni]|uniref:Hexosyltransferase n=1 Tax=Potamilus streckersoni TaxID=2493646 RepID=A0AAE0VGT0_9BIVA|nr:hypothetical protein CHS0354_002935 [Potamilus streckersoni]
MMVTIRQKQIEEEGELQRGKEHRSEIRHGIEMEFIPVNRFRRICCVILVAVGMFTAINIFKNVFHSSHTAPNCLDINVIESHAQYKYMTREEDGSVNIVFHVSETAPIAKFFRNKYRERNYTGIHHLMQTSTTQWKEIPTTKPVTIAGKLDSKPDVKITYPITAFGSPYVLNNDKICTGVHNLTFIIMVHTATDNFYRRSVMRETWANKDVLRNYSMRVLFLLGRPQDKKVQTVIEHESSLHKDIVQGNFLDTYHNLTHKGVLGYRWISEFCPQAKFVLKVDDDVFVNVFKLLLNMSKSYNADKRKIRCYVRINGTSPIQRKTGKWIVDDWEFINMTHFPVTYCNGFFVLLTTDIIKELYEASKKTPFFWVDDVYIFGLLPAKVGSVTFESVQGLNLNQKQALECFQKSEPCDYLAATAVDKGNMETLWFGAIHQYKNLVEAYAKSELLSV